MKKIFIILSIIFLFTSSSYGLNLSSEEKENFYNGIVNNLFSSIEEGLISQGYSELRVKQYVTMMKGRINREELQNMTWSCVNKYDNLEDKEQISHKCFKRWVTKFIAIDNADLLQIIEGK